MKTRFPEQYNDDFIREKEIAKKSEHATGIVISDNNLQFAPKAMN